MQRRTLVKTAVATSAATIVAPNVLFASKKKFRWRLVMVIPKTLPIWGEGVVQFAKDVETMSQGRLKIKVYGAGELVPALGTFDAVKAGRVQMGHSAPYYWQGKLPASVFFCAVPFGMDVNGTRAWLQTQGQELWDKLYGQHGLIAFPAGNTGQQMGGWYRKPIQSVADLKGLKMRIPGLGGSVLEKLGGKPVLMPGGEIFTNLSTGVIDATEWVGPYHDYIMGFHKAAQYYYYPGWHEPAPVLELMINKKAWNDLPKDLQMIVRTAAHALDRNMYAGWLAQDMRHLEKIKKETKTQIKAFPQEVVLAMAKAAEEVKAEVASKDPLSKVIYESYTNFQKQYQTHQGVADWALNDIKKAKI